MFNVDVQKTERRIVSIDIVTLTFVLLNGVWW